MLVSSLLGCKLNSNRPGVMGLCCALLKVIYMINVTVAVVKLKTLTLFFVSMGRNRTSQYQILLRFFFMITATYGELGGSFLGMEVNITVLSYLGPKFII